MAVTGASSGIGRACADRLHDRGWTVIGASRNPPADKAWQALRMDVDDDTSVTQGIARVLSDHGRLDAVVTAAGWGLAGPAETTPIGEARRQLETNFWGTVRVVTAALPAMRQQGAGRIVLVGSIGGVIGIPFQAYYSASKFALEGFGEALAYEVQPFGILVTIVQPGNVATNFTDNRRGARAEPDDPYKDAADGAISHMEIAERHGVPPSHVARHVERALDRSRPPRRLSVGRAGERFGLVAKRLLPHRLFERAARGDLGV